MSDKKQYIEEFDNEQILAAAIDILDSAMEQYSDVELLQEKLAQRDREYADLDRRTSSIISANRKTTKLLRNAIPKDMVPEEAAGMHDMVNVLLSWALGNQAALDGLQGELTDAFEIIRKYEQWHENFRTLLPEGIHTMFRKYFDNEEALTIHDLILEMPDSEWRNGVAQLAKDFEVSR
jgi:hypothetical protein